MTSAVVIVMDIVGLGNESERARIYDWLDWLLPLLFSKFGNQLAISGGSQRSQTRTGKETEKPIYFSLKS